jgi:exopolysaccharide/PEP-CTERM locus tyrosine autokinase
MALMTGPPDKLNLVEQLANRVGFVEGAAAAPAALAERPRPPAAEPPLASGEAPASAPGPRGQRVALDLERLRQAGMIVPGGARSRLSEEFRLIKRPLLLKAFAPQHGGRHCNLIMVTSPHPSEGKTFSSINLAMSLVSESDLNVLLIDGDVVRPTIMSTFGLSEERGLVDVVLGEAELTEVLVRCTNVPNLTLLPAGRSVNHVTELLASRRMAEFMVDIAARYPDRVVLIDTPPVLLTSETSVLALHVGQIVMVVGCDLSGPKSVDAALKLVSSCPNVSLILNRMTDRRRPGDFGAYYGYGA